jgi:glutamine phosphoribosylpyrophosphate amidotransferase
MCGIVGVVSYQPVNQLLYDALLLLQHRGQDAAGIATNHSSMFSMHKANGLVRDVKAIRGSATAAIRRPARRARKKRSRSTSTRRSASRSRTMAI